MPGIQEIAARAGVSPATVSRALRGLAHVNPKTREKIFEAAAEIGYPTAAIENLMDSGHKSRAVGVITQDIEGWYSSHAISGIEQALREADMDLVLYNFNQNQGRERIFQADRLNGLDALIIISLPPTEAEFQQIVALDIPIVLIGIHRDDVTSITINDYEGAKLATEHLVELGHTKIALMSDEPEALFGFTAPRDRTRAFHDVLSAHGITFNESHEVHGGFSLKTAVKAMDDLLSQPDRPTAIFCLSDEMAFGAMSSIRNHGLRVPEDISVVGFDDHAMSEFAGLTTVAQPIELLAQMAALTIMGKINKPNNEVKVLNFPIQLVIRNSTHKIN